MASVKFYSNWPKHSRYGDIVDFGDNQAIFAAQAVINEDVTPRVSGSAQPEDLDVLLKEAQRLASRRAATLARKVMSSWLDPDSKYSVGIGWRGTAAKNIYVSSRPVKARDGVMYTVREKQNTHNKYIRTGLKPESDSSAHVEISAFEQWVKDRGIEYAGRERSARDTAIRIYKSIQKSGMSSYWPDHVNEAEGRTFFNYPQKYLDDHARNDTEYVIRRLIAGDRGLRVDVTNVVMASLSTARLKAKINTKNYEAGSTGRRGRWLGKWQILKDELKYDLEFGDGMER